MTRKTDRYCDWPKAGENRRNKVPATLSTHAFLVCCLTREAVIPKGRGRGGGWGRQRHGQIGGGVDLAE